jgi:hypothetical protein
LSDDYYGDDMMMISTTPTLTGAYQSDWFAELQWPSLAVRIIAGAILIAVWVILWGRK